jgi:hypothetical protein
MDLMHVPVYEFSVAKANLAPKTRQARRAREIDGDTLEALTQNPV